MHISVRSLLCVMLLPACTTAYPPASASIGMVDEIPIRIAGTETIELQSRAYVAWLFAQVPGTGFEDRPVVFEPLYPQRLGDPLEFGPGRHRLNGRWQEGPRCARGVAPTLHTCKFAVEEIPGYRHEANYRTRVIIAFAAEEPLDPRLIAYQLSLHALENPAFMALLRAGPASQIAPALARAITDAPGFPLLWSADVRVH